MWALRGPTSAIRRRPRRAMLPPAAPTTQLSIERIAVGRPITRTERRTGRPPRTTETLELVPPHSTTIASETPTWCRAAATPAAGPEATVNDGRRRKASRLIAPPSPRRTSSGTSSPASRIPCSTSPAVRSTTGRIAALIAALTVRVSSPYAPLRSWPAQAGRPRARARSTTRRSSSGESTAKAPLTAIASQPRSQRRSSASSTVSTARPPVASRKTCSVVSERPGASPISPTRVRRRARRRSGAAPMPTTPTAGHVALEQRVHRLGGRERDELDAMAIGAQLLDERLERPDDPGGDAVSVRVRGRQ